MTRLKTDIRSTNDPRIGLTCHNIELCLTSGTGRLLWVIIHDISSRLPQANVVRPEDYPKSLISLVVPVHHIHRGIEV